MNWRNTTPLLGRVQRRAEGSAVTILKSGSWCVSDWDITTTPGWNERNEKRWKEVMFFTGRKRFLMSESQLLQSQQNSSARLRLAESLITCARCATVSMSPRRYFCFSNPKPASTKQRVWPTRIKSSCISWLSPTNTRQARQANTVLFLFCPQQLSAWRQRDTEGLELCSRWWCSMLATAFGPWDFEPSVLAIHV